MFIQLLLLEQLNLLLLVQPDAVHNRIITAVVAFSQTLQSALTDPVLRAQLLRNALHPLVLQRCAVLGITKRLVFTGQLLQFSFLLADRA